MKRFRTLNILSFGLVLLWALGSSLWAQQSIDWGDIDKTGSSLAHLQTRSASDLTSGILPPSRMSYLEDYMTSAFEPPATRDIPEITMSAPRDTALSSPVEYRPYICGTGSQVTGSDGQGDPYIRFGPGTYHTQNGANNDLAMYGSTKPGGGAQAAGWPLDATFITSSANSVVEIGFYSTGTSDTVMIQVNGRWLTDRYPIRPSAAVGNSWKLTMTFPSAASRRIMISGSHGVGLVAVRVPTGQSISKPVDVIDRRIAIVGDSFVNGAGDSITGGAGNTETFAPRLLHLMGADERILAGIGGTGFVAGGGTSSYETRLSHVLGKNPHVVIFLASVNDGTSGTGVNAAVASALALCESVPEVYVVSVLSSGYDANTAAAKAATIAAGRTFVEVPPPLYGSGYITNPKGDGPDDHWRMSDNVHPTFWGHKAIARAIFRQIGFNQ